MEYVVIAVATLVGIFKKKREFCNFAISSFNIARRLVGQRDDTRLQTCYHANNSGCYQE